MKKLLILLLASACTASFALPLAYEPFNYPLTPTNLVGHSTTDGLTWSQAGPTTGGTNVPSIVSGSLSYPGLAAGYGNSAQFGGVDSAGMAARLSLPSLVNSGSIYYSCLLKITDITGLSATSLGVFWAGFNNAAGSQGTLPSVVVSRIYTKTNATGGYQIGIAKKPIAAADVAYDSTPHNVGDTLLIVGCYDVINGLGGTDDTCRMWINPDASFFGGTEPAAPLSTAAGNDLTVAEGGVNSFCLFNRNAAEPHGIVIDQLILGTTWAEVTPTNIPLAITSQPRNQRSVAGGTCTFSVSTYNAGNFQWQHNSVAIPGATQRTLSLANIQTGDAGTYRVIVGNGASTPLTSSNATLTVYPDIYPRLVQLWSVAPSNRPYMTTDGVNTPNQRSFAYNSLSNQVLLVSRTNTVTSSTNPAVYVLHGDTGADLYQMNADAAVISGGASANSLSLCSIDAGDDGSVYAANVSDAVSSFRLYYWTNSDPSTPPQKVLDGDPSGLGAGLRFGDSMAVRGSGPSTQIALVDSKGAFGSLLFPPPGQPLNSNPWFNGFFTNATGGVVGGRTLLFFGATNTMWEKYGGSALNLLTYDTSAGVWNSSIVTNYPNVNNSPALVAFNATTNLLFAISLSSTNSAPDTLDQYDLADPSQPLFVRSYNFPVNHQGNANGFGRVVVSDDRVYALDGNNGMVAFRVEPVLSITPSGADVVLAWPASTPGYTLKATPSLSPPVTWTNVSTGTLIGQQYLVTNSASANALFYRLQK